jgi:hypothetical protein
MVTINPLLLNSDWAEFVKHLKWFLLRIFLTLH